MWDTIAENSTLGLIMVAGMFIGVRYFIPVLKGIVDSNFAVASELKAHNTISKEHSREILEGIIKISSKADHHSEQMERMISLNEKMIEAIALPKEFVVSQQEVSRALIEALSRQAK